MLSYVFGVFKQCSSKKKIKCVSWFHVQKYNSKYELKHYLELRDREVYNHIQLIQSSRDFDDVVANILGVI